MLAQALSNHRGNNDAGEVTEAWRFIITDAYATTIT